MKNALSFLLILWCSLNTQAQTFRFGLNLTPTLTGNFLHNDGSVTDDVGRLFQIIENQSFGYSGHLFTEYTLNTRSSLRFGLGYAQTGYKTDRTKLIFAQPDPVAPEYAWFSFAHRDIILPLLFRYNLSKRKNTFYLITGLTPQIKLTRLKTLHAEYADGRKINTIEDDHIADYRAVNVNGTLGIGYDLQLSAKTHLFFQPTFDCNMLGVAKSAALNRNIYSLGLSFGVML